MPVDATLSPDCAAATRWDAIVIGAGPAGAVAARTLALRGCRVLLVDKARFPRDKACGGCVSYAALSLMESVGLGALPERLGGRPTQTLLLAHGSRRATLPVARGITVARDTFDAALIRAAILAGAHFLPATPARISTHGAHEGEVHLGARTTRAAAIVAADGLAGSSLRDVPELQTHVRRHSWIGAAAKVIEPDARCYAPGIIHMACAPGGYVGVVRTDAQTLNVALACDPREIRNSGGLTRTVERIVGVAGLPQLRLSDQTRWLGTPPLTVRRRPVAHRRLFLIGDTAEYVEPFTGEGMAWAIATGLAVAAPALDAMDGKPADAARDWIGTHRALIAPRARACRLITLPLHHSRLMRWGIGLLARLPIAAAPIVDRLGTLGTLGERVRHGP